MCDTFVTVQAELKRTMEREMNDRIEMEQRSIQVRCVHRRFFVEKSDTDRLVRDARAHRGALQQRAGVGNYDINSSFFSNED